MVVIMFSYIYSIIPVDIGIE